MNERDRAEPSLPYHIPLIEERLEVRKELAETGHVRVSTRVMSEDKVVRETLAQTRVRVERHAVDRIVDAPPPVRSEGDRTVVFVVEEVMVKRYRIVEEVHMIVDRSEEPFEERVTLRRNEVTVERD